MQSIKNYIKQFLFGIIGVCVLLGFKMYNKGQSHDTMKADLDQACDKEKPCIKAVNKHFDACFDGVQRRRKAQRFEF